jgi:hypothetical protein
VVDYLTPAAFRDAGFGMDLSSYTDATLRTILQGAAARVNAYCSTPNLPQPHDFRGGTITDERHIWNLNSAQRRVYPWHQPIKTIDSFRLLVTESNYIIVSPNDMFINNSSTYVEIVALTLGIGVFPVVAALSLSQPVASIGYTYGSSFPLVGETLYETDGQTFGGSNQWWDETVTPVVYKNGTVQTTGFTLDYDEGAVVFSTELDASDVVKADYNYTLQPAIARATGVIANDMIGQARFTARDMDGLSVMRVGPGEVELRRSNISTLTRASNNLPQIPDEAQWLLEPFRFRS